MNGKDERKRDKSDGSPQIDGPELPPILDHPTTADEIIARELALEPDGVGFAYP